nr:uncharacterized protein LOC109780825 [Aegilops tauschii subsp. strangulata]
MAAAHPRRLLEKIPCHLAPLTIEDGGNGGAVLDSACVCVSTTDSLTCRRPAARGGTHGRQRVTPTASNAQWRSSGRRAAKSIPDPMWDSVGVRDDARSWEKTGANDGFGDSQGSHSFVMPWKYGLKFLVVKTFFQHL